jgi:hypothetical protein
MKRAVRAGQSVSPALGGIADDLREIAGFYAKDETTRIDLGDIEQALDESRESHALSVNGLEPAPLRAEGRVSGPFDRLKQHLRLQDEGGNRGLELV